MRARLARSMSSAKPEMRLGKSELTRRKRGILSLAEGISLVLLAVVMLCLIGCAVISAAIADSRADRLYELSEIPEGEYDCVLVLGAGLFEDGTPSPMLYDRVSVGAKVLEESGAGYILMSGDRSGDSYDEPAAMRELAISFGVEPERIILDGKGYSTCESIERAHEVYGFENVIVVTQEFHAPRALYIADSVGIEAVAVPSDLRPYKKQALYDLRETFARVKDFFACN